ncbi:polysaccharide deacetylase family protein [Verrucomicrobium sp. 3C]|uniref:polysaccharide deacetylase family protein n=1 Tax=Verrucomicrobium sp. 3C TaxID=1134055 RepID=UPI00037702E9|nr:polysaccharide deacetylase family protein [Verrucomicrobium sp. 3C]
MEPRIRPSASSPDRASAFDRRPAWRPSVAIRISLWLHATLLAALPLFPNSWIWLLAVLLGNHLLLAFSGLWPKSSLLGPNLVRLPRPAAHNGLLALTFDDGPDPETTPAILYLLDSYGAKASFFCIGKRAEEHSELVRDIVRRGHSVENHSLRHPNLFACYSLGALQREIQGAQSVLAACSGTPPRFFRSPMGFRNPFLDPALSRIGLRYVSWTRRGFDAACQKPETVLRRLIRNLSEGDILLLHDGNSACTSDGKPVSVQVLSSLLPILHARGLRAVSLPMAMGG